MKHLFLSLILALFCAVCAEAQVDSIMRVTRTDGRIQYVPITQIEKVDFIEKEPWTGGNPDKAGALDYLVCKGIRCERISNVLIFEFTMENMTPDELTINFSTPGGFPCKDDLGNSYSYDGECAVGNQAFSKSKSVGIAGYETKFARVRINDFKYDNVSSIDIAPVITIEGKKYDYNCVSFNMNITDNRPIRDGIRTCDKNLEFNLLGCERVGDELIVDFTIQNNSNRDIENFYFDVSGGITCVDDLNNTFGYSVQCAFKDQKFSKNKSISIESEQMVEGQIRVDKYDSSNPEYISIYPLCSSSDYVLEAKKIQFQKMFITDNRIKRNGINTCDRKLDFELVSFSRDNGNGIIEYTITNNSDKDIQELFIDVSGITCRDDLGNTYGYDTRCAFGEQSFSKSKSISLKKGESITGFLQILKFSVNASYVSVYPAISSVDYRLEDGHIHFVQISTEE